MAEHCGSHQRKFDGLGEWRFRTFIEGLPITLQIDIPLLTRNLSRYTSIASVVISFTVLGFLPHVGIVVAGTPSYE